MPDDFKTIFEKLKGKKAKFKPLPEEPQDTTSKKLPKDLLKEAEEHFGAKLNKVRIHTDGNSEDICKQLKAKAFTVGADIYFRKPGWAKDKKMVAHELAHVIQQQGGKISPKPKKGKALVSK